MCGIVGYVGKRNAVPILVEGLEHLEYRGYDSAGIACLNHRPGNLFIIKEQGNLAALKEQISGVSLDSNIGIGHTRWATHGEPSRANAHPHTDSRNQLAIVHNGIIENYAVLKSGLQRKGVRFRSQTDTEVAVNLIGHYYRKGHLREAFLKAVKDLHGFFAFAILAKDNPNEVLVFKRSNPLVIGLGEGENFIASDVSALLPHTHQVLFLEDDEYAIVTRSSVEIFSLPKNKRMRREPVTIKWNIAQARKSGYPHFMLKEIHEQPRVMEESLSKRLTHRDEIFFDTIDAKIEKKIQSLKRVYLVSCGTAYHAGLIGARMIEDVARVSSFAQVSSEFRYNDPIVGTGDLVILITQSGETADTLAALREAKRRKAFTLAIVNVVGSTIAREADAVIYTHAGPEIGVASTKAYTAQLMTLAFFAIYFAKLKKNLAPARMKEFAAALRKLPKDVEEILKKAPAMDRYAKKYFKCGNFLYLGRGYNYPTALEGSLKLKEISYAHAHGYAAGEMKHGPIALIDQNQPVICIAPESKTYEKMISNIEEIRARRGRVIAIGTKGDKCLPKLAEVFFEIPKTLEIFSPMLSVIPLQFLAYEIAVLNGRDVDHPRNLAKSVTVE